MNDIDNELRRKIFSILLSSPYSKDFLTFFQKDKAQLRKLIGLIEEDKAGVLMDSNGIYQSSLVIDVETYSTIRFYMRLIIKTQIEWLSYDLDNLTAENPDIKDAFEFSTASVDSYVKEITDVLADKKDYYDAKFNSYNSAK